MANIFSIVLVLITLLTGIIWALDKFLWAKARASRVEAAKAGAQLTDDAIAKLEQEPVLVENAKSLFPVIALVMVLRSFVYEPFQIPSESMMPTLLVGDFILVEKFSYGLKDPVFRKKFLETGEPERGDVAVFKYPLDTQVDYIKRIVGLPGDQIAYRNKQLFIREACDGGKPCGEYKKVATTAADSGEYTQLTPTPYGRKTVQLREYTEQLGEVSHHILKNPIMKIKPNAYFQQSSTPDFEWVVPEGHYFVLGDNRDNSVDSRYWGFVSDEHLVGKAVAIWISFEKERTADSILPQWVPSGVRFNRIGAIE